MGEKASIDHVKFLELEYQQIRAEILKRIELRQQLIQITMVFAAALIGTGVQTKNPLLCSIYPPFAFCFAMLWTQNDIRGRQLGTYIRHEIEGGMGGWESYYKANIAAETKLWRYPLSIFAPGGIFIVSELVAITFSVFIGSCSDRPGLLWILIAIDILFLLGTVILFLKALRNRDKTLKCELIKYKV